MGGFGCARFVVPARVGVKKRKRFAVLASYVSVDLGTRRQAAELATEKIVHAAAAKQLEEHLLQRWTDEEPQTREQARTLD